MTSPFPGMDPFLENPAYWPDFHATFVNYWREGIADALPPNYEASLGERVYLIEHDPEARKLGWPDVAITQDENVSPEITTASAGAVSPEPVIVPLLILDGPRETYSASLLHHISDEQKRWAETTLGKETEQTGSS